MRILLILTLLLASLILAMKIWLGRRPSHG